MSASVLEFQRRRAVRQPPPPGDDATPRQVRQWIRRVLAHGDAMGPFSPTRLAESAGVAPSTISRFLAGAYNRDGERREAGTPSLDTLNRIAAAAGVPRPSSVLAVADGLPMRDIAVVSPQLWLKRGRAAAVAGASSWVRAACGRRHCLAAYVTENCPSVPGVLPGDLVLFDPERPADDSRGVLMAYPDGACCVVHIGRRAAERGGVALGAAVEVRREL